jgi:hypothetical protein
MWRAFLLGILIWIAGTITIRLVGQHLLQPGHSGTTLLLYGVSFLAMILLVRGICLWLALERKMWIRAAGWLSLPTLLLDPISCAFFAEVFPNIDAAAAGIFGGWMLICCGGVVAGALVKA